MGETTKPPSIGNDTLIDYLNAIWQAAKVLAAKKSLVGITNTDGDLIQDAGAWSIDEAGNISFAGGLITGDTDGYLRSSGLETGSASFANGEANVDITGKAVFKELRVNGVIKSHDNIIATDTGILFTTDGATGAQSEVAGKFWASQQINSVATSLIFKPPVSTFTALSSTYPAPSLGWAAMVTDVGFIYSYNGSAWVSTGLNAFPTDLPTFKKFDEAKVNNKDVLYAIRDANGDVLFCIYADGTTNIDYVAPPSLNYTVLAEGWLNFKQVLFAIVDANGDVVIAYYADGTTTMGDISGLQSEVVAARGQQSTLNDRIKNTIKPYAIPTTALWGGERLRRWIEWNRSRDYRYDWLLIGDSYTQGFYSQWLRKFLMNDGYPNGGAGWCSFSRWGTALNTINSSINPEDLDFTYTPSQWDFTTANTFGLCGHVTSNTVNATITINATQLLDAVTIVYEKHNGAGDFQYRVNGGSWTNVSTANATQVLASLTVNTSSLTSSFTIDIQALSTGIVLMGCIGRKNGNVLNIHKAGISGGNAGMFAQNQLWSDNAALTTPKGVAIMFGTNEKMGNTTPATFRTNVQNIITKVKAIEPYCDILLMSPTYTTNETESPTTYSLDAYAQVLYELAIANDAAFLNYAQVFGAFSQAAIDAGFMNTDRIHPGVTRGSKLMAETFVKILK